MCSLLDVKHFGSILTSSALPIMECLRDKYFDFPCERINIDADNMSCIRDKISVRDISRYVRYPIS